jgi:hypothetical protein
MIIFHNDILCNMRLSANCVGKQHCVCVCTCVHACACSELNGIAIEKSPGCKYLNVLNVTLCVHLYFVIYLFFLNDVHNYRPFKVTDHL